MKMNHLNLAVTDVAAAENFLEKYFGLQSLVVEVGEQKDDKKFTALADENGIILTLMKAGQANKYPNSFHIGFVQSSEEQVNEIYQRLREDDFDVEPPQRAHAWTFYVRAPGGFMIEVSA